MRVMKDLRRALILALAGLMQSACVNAVEPLEVIWLANEGVLLSVGTQQVLVDAFIPERYSIYTALPADVAEQLLAGQPPFEAIELALVSHVHRDHFQPDYAQSFLEAHPETRLVSSPQVAALLPAAHAAVDAHFPPAGQSSRIEGNDIDVELLNLPHGIDGMQNLGHVIEIGGYRVLHVGDAEMEPAHFEPYKLQQRRLDVALIPYWYFSSATGRQLIATHLDARLQIAVHIPRPGEDDEHLAVAADAGARVPLRPMQQWRLERPRRRTTGN